MAQKAENKIGSGDVFYAYPVNSTAIASGDAVMLNPATGRIQPLTLTRDGQHRFCGICDEDWDSTNCTRRFGAGTTAYAAPATTTGVQRLRVQTKGIYDLAISDTTGYAGQTVYLATATSGGQVFTITQPDTDNTLVIVGQLAEDFSGATANDVQKVVIYPQMDNINMAIIHYLKNHVVDGMWTGWDASSHISYNRGIVFVDGVMVSFASAINTLPHLCAAKATQRRIVLYVVNSGFTTECIDNAAVLFTASAATATALADSQFWPSTSYLIFAAGYLGSNSTDFNAGAVRNVRRNVVDIAFRRFIN